MINLPCFDAFFDYTNVIAHIDNLRQLRGNHDDGLSLARKLGNEMVNFLLGADVNAARRFIENQHVHIAREPLCQNNFLLIAARQAVGRKTHVVCLDAKFLLLLLTQLLLCFLIDKAKFVAQHIQRAKGDIVRNFCT